MEWLGTVDTDADTALSDCRRDSDPDKVEKASQWLLQFLAKFAYPSEEVAEAGKAAGYTRNNLFEAKKKIGNDRIKASNHGRFGGVWHWGLGEPAT